MPPITKDIILGLQGDDRSRRKQFSSHSGIQKKKKPGSPPTFSVSFDNGLCKLFRDGTGMLLEYNQRYAQYYCYLKDAAAVAKAEAWEKAQGSRVFIRNAMASTLALDLNFGDKDTGRKTEVGLLEEAAKHNADVAAISKLAEISAATILDVSYLRSCQFVCGIPAPLEKGFDLPRALASRIAALTGKEDITLGFKVEGKERSAKTVSLSEKWDVWDECKIEYERPDLRGKDVLLVDDKYQSGVTIQFWAGILQNLGASSVHGLCMVKTLRDTDNLG